jgi:hypothetical protein
VVCLLREIFPKIREILYQFDSNQGVISSIIGKTFLQLNYSLNGRVKILFPDSREKFPY